MIEVKYLKCGELTDASLAAGRRCVKGQFAKHPADQRMKIRFRNSEPILLAIVIHGHATAAIGRVETGNL